MPPGATMVRRSLLVLLPAFALAGAEAMAQPASPEAVLAAWAEAYATNDGPRCALLYTEDARLWGSVSRAQTVGRAAIADYFGRVRPGATAIAVRFRDFALRPVTADVAIASGRYTFVRILPDGTERLEPSRFSMTFVRGADGAWRIADHHSSRMPPPP
jgi:uncharacterized protein (TIGR02246 family)